MQNKHGMRMIIFGAFFQQQQQSQISILIKISFKYIIFKLTSISEILNDDRNLNVLMLYL